MPNKVTYRIFNHTSHDINYKFHTSGNVLFPLIDGCGQVFWKKIEAGKSYSHTPSAFEQDPWKVLIPVGGAAIGLGIIFVSAGTAAPEAVEGEAELVTAEAASSEAAEAMTGEALTEAEAEANVEAQSEAASRIGLKTKMFLKVLKTIGSPAAAVLSVHTMEKAFGTHRFVYAKANRLGQDEGEQKKYDPNLDVLATGTQKHIKINYIISSETSPQWIKA